MSRAGTLLFTPTRLGSLTISNKFMRSATWEAAADEDGIPTPPLVKMMHQLALGGVGLILPGAVYCSKSENMLPGQSGLCTQAQMRVWRRDVIPKVHEWGSKLMFQLAHGGVGGKSSVNDLTISEIGQAVQDFVNSSKLAVEAGADGIQLHCAHGYFLSSFMSPAKNQRTDKYGGSEEGRLRIVNEIIDEVKRVVPSNFLLSIKMNGCDFVPNGITADLAARYVSLLKKKLHFFEVSCGMTAKHTIRSDVNDANLSRGLQGEEKARLLRSVHETMDGLGFTRMYTRDICRVIKQSNPDAILAMVGGHRIFREMEEVVKCGDADLISLSRPLLNDGYLVKRFEAGTMDHSLCSNCGSCVLSTGKGVYCHMNERR
jgi:2,4-dienoyl-CoA reductase-like NADH-dependent reductase (Old Yellow Enzyme family)